MGGWQALPEVRQARGAARIRGHVGWGCWEQGARFGSSSDAQEEEQGEGGHNRS